MSAHSVPTSVVFSAELSDFPASALPWTRLLLNLPNPRELCQACTLSKLNSRFSSLNRSVEVRGCACSWQAYLEGKGAGCSTLGCFHAQLNRLPAPHPLQADTPSVHQGRAMQTWPFGPLGPQLFVRARKTSGTRLHRKFVGEGMATPKTDVGLTRLYNPTFIYP